MISSSLLPLALATLMASSHVSAANADQWRSRSIYQLITDRFAPPSASAPARTSPLPETCDPALQTWCGGTFLSIIDELDYIQGMGFDSIWISPVTQNIDIYTPYNYAYHGYWVNNVFNINPRFGSEADLLTLSNALHERDMYLMVDIVVNNIPALSINTSTSAEALTADLSMWTDPAEFHPQCWIDFNNETSVEYCWLGDDKLALMDVNTENETVISTLNAWIANFTRTYSVDGLRIDGEFCGMTGFFSFGSMAFTTTNMPAAKHVPGVFWQGFCGAAGVFCIGEVYGNDIPFAASFQTQKWMDSVLGFPLYYGIVNGFGQPMGNMSSFVDLSTQVLTEFPDPGLLGNFLENHDLPRWRNTTVDPQLAYNAMIVQFLFDGIPVVYYGQEQDFGNGANDPYNRAALWPSNYTNTTTYQRMGRLNEIRQAVIKNNTQFNGKNYMDTKAEIVASTNYDVAFRKGPILAVLTNRGSPSQAAAFGVTNSGFSQSAVDLLSCKIFTLGYDGALSISYSASGYGGMPYVFVAQADAMQLGLCPNLASTTYTQPSGTPSGAAGRAAAVDVRAGLGMVGAGLGLVMLGLMGGGLVGMGL